MDFSEARKQMILRQLVLRGITDVRVLAAFAQVPRHKFVPEEYEDEAYEDHPVPIGRGQTVSQPYIIALMLQAIKPQDDMRVLEIGTGSGYVAALLAHMGMEVHSVERHSKIKQEAEEIIKELGYIANIVQADGFEGLLKHAPYDAIIVSAAAQQTPPALIDQLKEGGVLIIPIGEDIQELLSITKMQNQISMTPICQCRFVSLKPGKE